MLKLWRKSSNSLFRVVSRIGKYLGVNAAKLPIRTLQHYAMLVCSKEVVIKYGVENTMHKLLSAMSEYLGRGAFTGQVKIPVMKVVWKLTMCVSENSQFPKTEIIFGLTLGIYAT